MTVKMDGDAIVLTGTCGVEEVEELLRLLSDEKELAVDIAGAEWIHTALWQVLFMHRPAIRSGVPGSFAASHVIPNMHFQKPE